MADPNTTIDALPKGIDKPSNDRHTLVIERFVVHFAQVEDILFHFGSSVLLPAADGDARPNEPKRARTSGLSVIGDALGFAKKNPSNKCLLAGHTDTVSSAAFNLALSARRATNVQLYLAGKRDEWAAHCFKAHKIVDYQNILHFIAEVHQVPCEPGVISGVLDNTTIAALGDFRQAYNFDDRFKGKARLPLVGPIGAEDFAAFYDFYDLTLTTLIENDVGDPNSVRAGLKFVEPPVVGCGENFPVEDLGDEQRSAKNRRVDILFFKPGQEPKLNVSPPGIEIYGGLLYEQQPIVARSEIRIQIRHADGKPASGVKYVVTWPDLTTRDGTLDGEGSAVVTDAPGGECVLELQAEGWLSPD